MAPAAQMTEIIAKTIIEAVRALRAGEGCDCFARIGFPPELLRTSYPCGGLWGRCVGVYAGLSSWVNKHHSIERVSLTV